jgi:hypothetical protein
VETAKPIQAALVSIDLIESSLLGGKVRPRWLIREPRGCGRRLYYRRIRKRLHKKRQAVRTRNQRPAVSVEVTRWLWPDGRPTINLDS